MSRLLLLTPAELTRDPRARRQAREAARRGLEVVGVSGRISGESPAPLEGVEVVRVGAEGRTDPAWTTGVAAHRHAGLRRELRGLYRLARLGVRTAQLARGGRRAGHVAVVHANDLATLPAGFLLARRSGARLVYDAHELYSQFEHDAPRIERLLMLHLEAVLARRADAVVTVNDALAGELRIRLGLPRRPYVVLNAPDRDEQEPPPGTGDGPLRAVYQGAFGPGRTLDDLAAAVRLAPSVELTLRIPRTPVAELRRLVTDLDLGDRILIADPVAPHEVVRALHGFDVGLVFDRPLTQSGELALPNKLFEYLMAGLAIVVPHLPALASVVDDTGAGETFEPGRPDALAAVLERLAGDRELLAGMRRRAREAALTRFNAERQGAALARAWDV